MSRSTPVFLILLSIIFFLNSGICMAREVVVYTSVDQVFSEPVLKTFEEQTGIKVRALYDVEASKTVGLVNRLIAEKKRPKADVFWNSEVSRTIGLKDKAILAPYQSVHWQSFPELFKDSEYYWTGFGARARVLIWNTQMLKQTDLPESIFELIQPKWQKKVTIAYPLFGTTAMHVAAWYSIIGQEKTEAYLRGLVANQIVVVDGNSITRDLVAQGRIPIGFTDTDDANVAIVNGQPVKMLFPDKKGIGTLLIPHSVAMIKNGPNPENAKQFIDYLLSTEVESRLAFGESAQMPLRSGVKRPDHMADFSEIKAMDVDYNKISQYLESASRFCQELFVR
ncbi:MAG: extracellular solute-binding protein [Pseudomonadota bacterium]